MAKGPPGHLDVLGVTTNNTSPGDGLEGRLALTDAARRGEKRRLLSADDDDDDDDHVGDDDDGMQESDDGNDSGRSYGTGIGRTWGRGYICKSRYGLSAGTVLVSTSVGGVKSGQVSHDVRGLPSSTYAIVHAIWTYPPPFCM